MKIAIAILAFVAHASAMAADYEKAFQCTSTAEGKSQNISLKFTREDKCNFLIGGFQGTLNQRCYSALITSVDKETNKVSKNLFFYYCLPNDGVDFAQLTCFGRAFASNPSVFIISRDNLYMHSETLYVREKDNKPEYEDFVTNSIFEIKDSGVCYDS